MQGIRVIRREYTWGEAGDMEVSCPISGLGLTNLNAAGVCLVRALSGRRGRLMGRDGEDALSKRYLGSILAS